MSVSVILNFYSNHNKLRDTHYPHFTENRGTSRFIKPRGEGKWCLQKLLPFAFLLRDHHSIFPVTERGLLNSHVTLSTYYILIGDWVLDVCSSQGARFSWGNRIVKADYNTVGWVVRQKCSQRAHLTIRRWTHRQDNHGVKTRTLNKGFSKNS